MIPMRPAPELIQQAEQDLRWLVHCPALIDSPLVLDLPDPFSSDIEIDWSPVLRFHETKAAHRVGYYVESLIQVWLESTPGISDLRHGIQIIREKETLGELDFLFRREGKLHHLEVALKFYLYTPDHSVGGCRFIGPNAADTFEKKRDRLLEKQIPFGREFFPGIDESHILVKGMIFYDPRNALPESLPRRLNPHHARGQWTYEAEFEERFGNCGGAVLPKPFWLAVPDELQEAAREAGHLQRELARLRERMPSRPRFLHRLIDAEAGTAEKLFLVPGEWPGGK
jgi:hypothetical protein